MNNQDIETLSAMLDNEADELELRRVVKAAADDPEIAATWQRLSLVQALLHDDNLKSSDCRNLATGRLADGVAEAIASEPVPRAEEPAIMSGRWTRPLARLGIAASVALAFFLGMQTTVNSPSRGAQTPVAQQQPAVILDDTDGTAQLAVASTDSAVAEPAPRQVDPQARRRLDDYIQSVSITRDEPQQLEQLQDSPLYRLVNERLANENPSPE